MNRVLRSKSTMHRNHDEYIIFIIYHILFPAVSWTPIWSLCDVLYSQHFHCSTNGNCFYDYGSEAQCDIILEWIYIFFWSIAWMLDDDDRKEKRKRAFEFNTWRILEFFLRRVVKISVFYNKNSWWDFPSSSFFYTYI